MKIKYSSIITDIKIFSFEKYLYLYRRGVYYLPIQQKSSLIVRLITTKMLSSVIGEDEWFLSCPVTDDG